MPIPPWVSDPAGPVAREIVPLYWFMFGAAVIVLAIGIAAVVLFGGNGMDAATVTRRAIEDSLFRWVLLASWTLATVPAARVWLGTPETFFIRALPVSRVAIVGSFIIATEPLGRSTAATVIPKGRMVSDTRYIGHYYRLTEDDRLLFGGRARFALSDPESDRKSGDILLRDVATIFPQIAILGALYTMINRFELYDSLQALVLSYMILVLPFTVWVLTSFMRALPKDLEEAAYIDGASPLQVFYKVVLPSAIPFILTGMRVALGFSFMGIVAAELIGAREGIGFLIMNSQMLLQTEQLFVGLLTLGVVGLIVDRVFRWLLARSMKKPRVIAETGAGMHGVAAATVSVRVRLEDAKTGPGAPDAPQRAGHRSIARP